MESRNTPILFDSIRMDIYRLFLWMVRISKVQRNLYHVEVICNDVAGLTKIEQGKLNLPL